MKESYVHGESVPQVLVQLYDKTCPRIVITAKATTTTVLRFHVLRLELFVQQKS